MSELKIKPLWLQNLYSMGFGETAKIAERSLSQFQGFKEELKVIRMEAIEKGFAEYGKKTGEWQWKESDK